jgi:hypothetical protein
VAYVGVWGYNNNHYYQPAFVFPGNLGNGHAKYVWEAVSHEVGHNLVSWCAGPEVEGVGVGGGVSLSGCVFGRGGQFHSSSHNLLSLSVLGLRWAEARETRGGGLLHM